jgi:hypothetical protein
MRAGINDFNDNAILPLSYGLAALYWWRSADPTALDILAKVGSTALLAYHGHKTTEPNASKHMVAALVCHCIGDLLIELPGNSLIYAIPAFFLGHSFYISTLQKNRFTLSELNVPRILAMAAFSLYGSAFTHLLTTKTEGVIQSAIPIYSLAISTMFMLACMQKENALRVFLGAFLYVASDNIIGANMFVKKIPGANYVSWPLYFLGQRVMLPDPKKNGEVAPNLGSSS